MSCVHVVLAGDLRCADLSQRRTDLLAHPNPNLNGIDFVEIDPNDRTKLRVVFLRPIPADGFGFVLQPDRIVIRGGVRVVGVQAVSAAVQAPNALAVQVNLAGDFSTYQLELNHPLLDVPLSRLPISFTATCPTGVDCRGDDPCPPEDLDEPLIDYLAKDYGSFRRLLTDVAAARHGSYTDGNAADLGQTLIELLSYAGDGLSYLQDAVATEAYLDTARQRRSIRRLTRLVDYNLHEGRNAWTWVVLSVSQPGTVGAGTPILSRIARPLTPGQQPPRTVIADAILDAAQPQRFEGNEALSDVMVFETAHDLACARVNNEIQVHTWGTDDAVLPEGSREGYLFFVNPSGQAVRPVLADGDFLLLEQVRGPTGRGLPVDADRDRRIVVQLEGPPEATTDPLYGDTLASVVDPVSGIAQWELQRFVAGPPLPLLRVRWRLADGLPWPLCLSSTTEDGRRLRSVSVARGNVVLADHGRTVTEVVEPIVAGRRPVELRLRRGPVTHQAPATSDRYTPRRPISPPRRTLTAGVEEAIPAVVAATYDTAGGRRWTPVPDLLDSTPSDLHLVAEPGGPVESGLAVPPTGDADAGAGGPGLTFGAGAVVRFGDGTYGADPESGRPVGSVTYEVTYRVGNGPNGNVGAETLVHIAQPPVAGGWPTVTRVRNPLPATGGTPPLPIAEARLAAPVAFSVDQRRAVTAADYAAAARRLPTVQGAVATFRWTGSWLTVFVGIDPADSADLFDLPDGRSRLGATLDLQVRIQLQRFRQAGYDLEIRPPTFIPLDIVLDICVKEGHFRIEAVEAVRRAMGRFTDESGRPAYFNPARWTFGQPVWLSSIYAAVEAVPGVDNVAITRFRRLGALDNGELDRGRLELGPAEIARCDNDPDFAEHGTLAIVASGGKG